MCNYLGTVIAGLVQWPGSADTNSQMTVVLLAALRFICIPIFMMCNLAPYDRRAEVRGHEWKLL